VETQNTQPCNNQTHKILKSFITMEALNLLLNLLLAMLVLWAARALVLVIWMIILIILGGVGRMVDFLRNRFENEVKLANSTVDKRSHISQPETPRKRRSLTAKKHPSLQNRHSVKTQLLARFEKEVKLANSTVEERSLISQAETLKRRSLKAKRPSLQNCHSVKTQRPLCSFKVLGSMSHHEEMESERPSTKRSCISQVEAPSSSSSCSIGDVRSTLPISTNSFKHSALQDEDESLLLGFSLLPADSDEESLKKSESEDESESEEESDSDFYFSDIPDDYGYSDDVVFDYNDVVIAPAAAADEAGADKAKERRRRHRRAVPVFGSMWVRHAEHGLVRRSARIAARNNQP